MIHCALCFNDATGDYFQHAYVTLLSVLENTSSSLHIHIISDETVDPNRHFFENLCAEYNQKLTVHRAPDFDPEIENLVPRQYGKAALYRFILHEILPQDRVIYFDCDIVVERDIRDLDNVDLGGAYLGAVRDYPWPLKDVAESLKHSSRRHMREYREAIGIDSLRYFNTGVLVMDLARIRTACEKANIYWTTFRKQTAIAPPMYADQDGINGTFSREGDVLFLDTGFNYIIADNRKWQSPGELTGNIVHFTHKEKPWKVFYPPALLYWKYFAMSPWAREWYDRFMQTWDKSSSYPFLLYVAKNPKLFRRIRDLKEFGVLKTIKAHALGKRLS